jgi:NAD(P)-dependent dehydrogenase (short-subunit alcohol dehydrogenase family)
MPRENPFSVEGLNVLVTGGSRGIGLMIARGLVTAGARIIVSSRKGDACHAAAEDLRRLGTCHAVPADVGTPEGVASLVDGVARHFDGRLDVLVNNAGANWGAPLEAFPDAAFDKVLRTNVSAVFACSVALLPALRLGADAGRSSRIINIGSVDGLHVPDQDNYSYTASKAALHMLTRHLARRLAPESITVNAIAPGAFESRMTAFMLDDPDDRARVVSQLPLGRIGAPDDIAATAQFLASRAGSYLTGTIIPLDGGLTGCL